MGKYVRDGRAPVPEDENVSKVMSANKDHDTTPELLMRQALREAGEPGYRLNWDKAPGRPDIAYPGKNVAVFVHGCYWHRCPHCDLDLPKSNTEWWREKFARNKERDQRKRKVLESQGWRVFTFWECQIKEDAIACAREVREHLLSLEA